MDNYRFYVPDLLAQARGKGRGADGAGGNKNIILPEDQAHHARTVLRLAAGDGIVLFDGQGGWAEATLSGDGGKRAALRAEIHGEIHADAPPARVLTIATAVPKGERAEWLIEQASQLNVACVQWMDCDRSVVKLPGGGERGGERVRSGGDWRWNQPSSAGGHT